MNEMLEAALAYAAAGIPVFPCEPGGKEPLKRFAPHGWQNETLDATTIRRWWTAEPKANIASEPGASNHAVADIDCKKGAQGYASWAALTATHGPNIGMTRAANTPSGGLHIWYSINGHEVRDSDTALGPGIELRCHGRYVLLPPSVINGVPYAWRDIGAECLPFPPALADLLKPKPRKQAATPAQAGDVLGGSYWLARANKMADITNRHNTGKWLAVQLRAAGLSIADAEVFMLDFAERCEELGECAEPAGEHMMRLLDWVYGLADFDKTPVTPGKEETPEEPEYLKIAPLEFIEAPPPEEPEWLVDAPLTVESLTQGDTNTGFTPPMGTKPIVQTSSWADIQESLASVVWEWPRWLARGIVHILVGQTGKGKSSVALAIASRYLTGNPWPDSTPFTSPMGKILWLEGEAAQALNLQRVRLWSLTPAHIICPFPDPMQDVNLDNPQHQQAIAATAAQPDIAIIVVDSLSGCMGSRRDENSTEMLNVVKWLARLARDLQKPVVLLHHLRKRGVLDTDDRISIDRVRGSSAILQAARLVWALDSPTERDPDALRLSVIKSNLDRFPAPVGVHLNENGVVFSTEVAGKPDARSQGDRIKEFLRTLLENGPVKATRCLEESEQAGFEKRWVEDVKRSMGVKSFKLHNVWHWGWEWESEELPM